MDGSRKDLAPNTEPFVDRTFRGGPGPNYFQLQVLTKRHPAYSSLKEKFGKKWEKDSVAPTVERIFKVQGGPCGERTCSVCNICTEGFKLEGNIGRTAQQTNFNLRYGEGLYFSSISGKANDYATNSEKIGPQGKKWRCMFMASVAIGKPFITTDGFLSSSQCPPQGFDSVVGEVGHYLRYDEVCVYSEKAALPSYLIVYSM